jgi:hypothetical protein
MQCPSTRSSLKAREPHMPIAWFRGAAEQGFRSVARPTPSRGQHLEGTRRRAAPGVRQRAGLQRVAQSRRPSESGRGCANENCAVDRWRLSWLSVRRFGTTADRISVGVIVMQVRLRHACLACRLTSVLAGRQVCSAGQLLALVVTGSERVEPPAVTHIKEVR